MLVAEEAGAAKVGADPLHPPPVFAKDPIKPQPNFFGAFESAFGFPPQFLIFGSRALRHGFALCLAADVYSQLLLKLIDGSIRFLDLLFEAMVFSSQIGHPP